MSSTERVERLLTSRLEDLAVALERTGAPPERVGRLLELASVATIHAVTLELLSVERAETIWKTAKERHPVLDQADTRLLDDIAA